MYVGVERERRGALTYVWTDLDTIMLVFDNVCEVQLQPYDIDKRGLKKKQDCAEHRARSLDFQQYTLHELFYMEERNPK